MKTATLVMERKVHGRHGSLYKLNTPVSFKKYNWEANIETKEETSYILFSSVCDGFVDETAVFPTNEDGVILDWLHLFEKKFPFDSPHEEIFTSLGYTPTEKEKEA